MAMDTRSKFEKIAEQVENWREELGVPGAAFGLRLSGETFTGGVGVTHVEHPLPVTDETIFQIGSISKTVTATAMMRLVERGKLDLHAPVRAYLPGFRVRDEDVSARVTPWHLLTHTAGWTGDVFTDTGVGDDAAAKYVDLMSGFEQLAPLERHFSYNNAAFCVAGRIIETVTGATYEAAIEELIFQPMCMERSYFFPHEAMLHRFAVGHEAGGRVLSPWAIPRGMNAAGGISCHIRDLLRYGEYHLGDGAPLMGRGYLAEMHKPQVRSLPYMGFCGLAWMISGGDDAVRLWHTGGTNGQNAALILVPARQLALGMMTNGDKGQRLHERFNKTVLSEFSQIEIPEARVIESAVEELAQYAGRYQGTMRAIELRMDEGRLLADIQFRGGLPSDRELEPMPPVEMARCGTDQLLVVDGYFEGTRADLLRDEAGDIRYLRFGSRLNPRVD